MDGTEHLRYSILSRDYSGVVQLVARQPLELVILVRVQAPEPIFHRSTVDGRDSGCGISPVQNDSVWPDIFTRRFFFGLCYPLTVCNHANQNRTETWYRIPAQHVRSARSHAPRLLDP